MTYSITELRFDDKSPLESLYENSLRTNAQGFIQDISFHGNIYDVFVRYEEQGGVVRVLKDNDTLIGMGALCPLDEKTVEVCKLHLAANYKGQGLGKRLLLSLLEEGKKKGFTLAELHVTATQKAAIGLYLNTGFQQWQRKNCVVSVNGKDEVYDTVFMRREL